MPQVSEAIEGFFRTFEANASSHDADAQISQFADVFMAANPQGAQTVRAGDFALALPKRKELFDRLGCRSSELLSVSEQRLDARYVLANTRWKMTFARAESNTEEVVVESSFMLDTGGNSPRILVYLAHQDIMQVLKDRGLLPA
jgi:hypothetical protein